MAFSIAPFPKHQFFDDSGNPLSAGTLTTYIAGTTTPVATYSDSSGTPNSNPITLDAAGRVVGLFLLVGSSYKFLLKNSAGATIWTFDNISAVPGASNIDIDAVAGETITTGQVVYLSDGSGALVGGRWYKAKADNAYSSVNCEIGIAITDMATAGSGTVRLIGRATSGITVSAGLTYYISAATSGALTSTAPTLARIVGVADTATSLVIKDIPAAFDNGINDFRLTLTTAVPVTTADVTAATTLFCSPYRGNRIALMNAAGIVAVYAAAEFSIAVPATTSQLYDIFAIVTAGVPALELLAWTNDTTRATALTTSSGILIKSGDPTRRYLGSFRTTTVSGQTEDSFAKRYLWNYYNRVRRGLRVTEPVDSYAYTTDTYRQANANPANQLDVVIGFAEVLLTARVVALFSSGSADQFAIVSIGEDSTTTAITGVTGQGSGSTASGSGAADPLQVHASLEKYPPVGRHTYVWLERAGGGGAVTWYGDNGAAAKWQGGISGTIDG